MLEKIDNKRILERCFSAAFSNDVFDLLKVGLELPETYTKLNIEVSHGEVEVLTSIINIVVAKQFNTVVNTTVVRYEEPLSDHHTLMCNGCASLSDIEPHIACFEGDDVNKLIESITFSMWRLTLKHPDNDTLPSIPHIIMLPIKIDKLIKSSNTANALAKTIVNICKRHYMYQQYDLGNGVNTVFMDFKRKEGIYNDFNLYGREDAVIELEYIMDMRKPEKLTFSNLVLA